MIETPFGKGGTTQLRLRTVRRALHWTMLTIVILTANSTVPPAVAQSGTSSRSQLEIDQLARTLINSIDGSSRVALLPLDRRIGLPEEAHQRFYDALANALGRNAKRGIKMIAGPRQRDIYRHLVETFEEDLDEELKSILRKAQADFVIICLFKSANAEKFELSCAPTHVETVERQDGEISNSNGRMSMSTSISPSLALPGACSAIAIWAASRRSESVTGDSGGGPI